MSSPALRSTFPVPVAPTETGGVTASHPRSRS